MKTIQKPPRFEPVTDRRKFLLQLRTLTIILADRAVALRNLSGAYSYALPSTQSAEFSKTNDFERREDEENKSCISQRWLDRFS